MKELLSYHKLKLYYSRNRLVSRESSLEKSWDIAFWRITGGNDNNESWHMMTTKTNEDKSTGLDEEISLDCPGAWKPGTMEKDVILKHYGEVLFEHYLKNDNEEDFKNDLYFYINGAKKLARKGPSPWQRCIPIGLPPGKNLIKFQYEAEGEFKANKGVVDTVTVWEGKPVDCLIADYTPPAPIRSLGKSEVLRGFTRYQEMTVADTEIKFSAIFNGASFFEFMQKIDEPFYFVDEFGVCYRGIFPEKISPRNIAMNEVYVVELSLVAGQKTGFGFC